MATMVMTWLMSLGIGILMVGSWLRADRKRPQAQRIDDYPPVIVGTHLALMAAGIAVWVVWVVKGNGPGPWFGFVDLVVFACVGDELILAWAHSRLRRRWIGILHAPSDLIADDPIPVEMSSSISSRT